MQTMQDYFRRFRALRGKSLQGTTYDALQYSWCAFIQRWNRMYENGNNFQQWLANREEFRADHSIGALREKVCENAWNEDRLCYVHVNEGCTSCNSVPRPSRDDWEKHIAECPLSERERVWIAKYERSLSERRAAVIRGAPHWRHHSRQRSQSPLNIPHMSATRSPDHHTARFSSRSRVRSRNDPYPSRRSRSRSRGDPYPSRRSRTRRRDETNPSRRSRSRDRGRPRPYESPRRSRAPRERSHQQMRRDEPTPWTHNPERRLEPREGVTNAPPMYPARVESQAIASGTYAREESRATHGPTMSYHGEGPRDLRYDPQANAPGLQHQRAVEGPREGNAGVLVAQDDVDEAVNKAADAQLEAEAALERAAQAERTASEIRQSNRELLERMRNLERQVLGHAQTGTQPRPMSLARQARREGRSIYEPETPISESTREA